MKYFNAIILLFTLLLSSCVKNNPDPSWLEITEWTLTENQNVEEGELSHSFKDVYVYVDDKIVGIFELPVKLPLLLEGKHKVTLYPVIRINGISGAKTIYPFCKPLIVDVNLEKNKTTPINATTSYLDNTTFWIEDFENSTFKIDDSNPNSTGDLSKKNDPNILKFGNFYGDIAITSVDSVWFGKTTPALNLPKGAAEIYLEIDYMNTNTLLTGVYALSSTSIIDNPHIQLNAQDASDLKWKKIYIELKEIVSASTAASSFEQYFKAILDEGLSEGHIYIDNIKIVHF